MNEFEFKFLVNRITILSDRCAGLKVQNNVLHKRISVLEIENRDLDLKCDRLASKVTELNHELQKYKKEDVPEMPNNDFHGQINIKELKR